MSIKCPLCHAYLEDDGVLSIGEIIYCDECFKDFEVVRVKPLRLQPLTSWLSDNDQGAEDTYFDS